MKYKMLRLVVCPAIEATTKAMYKEFPFRTKAELLAAKESMADLLLFMQDEIGCMEDFSNWFVIEVLPVGEDAEWEEIEEEDLPSVIMDN